MSDKQSFTEQGKDAILEYLQERALERYKQQVRQIKDFATLQPDHEFTHANKHVLDLDTESSWNAAGLLSVSGFAYWALNLSVDLAPPHLVIYNATGGPDWSISVFTSSVAGYFLVDPSTLGGTYKFRIQSVAGAVGEVTCDLYKSNGTQIASFLGAVVGVSVSNFAGSGTLSYH